MISLFVKGGPMMWALLCCSVLGFYIIFYKLFYLLLQTVSYQKIKRETTYLLRSQPHDTVIKTLRSKPTILHHAAAHAVALAKRPRVTIQDSIRTFTLEHVNNLEKHMSILASLITVTPLLGLMGTVLGLMNIFNVISGGGIGNTQALSVGIAEALITTVTGLAIAAPFIVMHHYLSQRIENLGLQLERMILDIRHLFTEPDT